MIATSQAAARTTDKEWAMRSRQILPIALLAFFAIGLFLAIAAVQMAKNQAEKDYMAEEARINEIRDEIYDAYAWVDKQDREEKFVRRMKNLDQRQQQAEKQWQEANAAAYTRQGYIIGAGIGLFVVFVAVTLYIARKSADNPQT
jgi:Flp pilus assembly protein TadB